MATLSHCKRKPVWQAKIFILKQSKHFVFYHSNTIVLLCKGRQLHVQLLLNEFSWCVNHISPPATWRLFSHEPCPLLTMAQTKTQNGLEITEYDIRQKAYFLLEFIATISNIFLQRKNEIQDERDNYKGFGFKIYFKHNWIKATMKFDCLRFSHVKSTSHEIVCWDCRLLKLIFFVLFPTLQSFSYGTCKHIKFHIIGKNI